MSEEEDIEVATMDIAIVAEWLVVWVGGTDGFCLTMTADWATEEGCDADGMELVSVVEGEMYPALIGAGRCQGGDMERRH